MKFIDIYIIFDILRYCYFSPCLIICTLFIHLTYDFVQIFSYVTYCVLSAALFYFSFDHNVLSIVVRAATLKTLSFHLAWYCITPTVMLLSPSSWYLSSGYYTAGLHNRFDLCVHECEHVALFVAPCVTTLLLLYF